MTLQSAAKKRSSKHLAERDELICIDGMLIDHVTFSACNHKMACLVSSIQNEILDKEIHNHHVLGLLLGPKNILIFVIQRFL